MEKYIEFHSRYGLCDTSVEGKDPYVKLKNIIIDKIDLSPKDKIKIKPNNNFQDHEFLMKVSIDMKYLYWEQMVKEAKHDQQIEKFKISKRDKKSERD